MLHAAERIAAGEVPYRDVYFIYTPGLEYLLSLLFRLFGTSLAVHHALQLAWQVAMALVVLALARRLRVWPPLAALVVVIVIVGGLNFYRYVLGLATVLVLTYYVDDGRRATLLGGGVLAGVTYVFAQEVGIYVLGAALGSIGLDWLARSRRPADVPALVGRGGVLLGGTALVLGPWLGVLVAQGAFWPMLDDTLRVAALHQPRYMHVPLPPLLPLIPDDLSAQVVWGPQPYLTYVKYMLYLPLVAVVAGAIVVVAQLRRAPDDTITRRAVLLILFATLALGSLRFRADYYHLRVELPVTLLLVAWLLTHLRLALRARGWPASAGPLVLLPFTLVLAVSLGEAFAHREEQSTPLHTARGTVHVDEVKARDLGGLLAALRERVAPDEPIFVWPAETAVYFLADRRNPTLFGQMVSTELEVLREDDARLQRDVIAAIEAGAVCWGVSAPTDNVNGYAFADYAPLVASYLEGAFAPDQRFGYWTLQRRVAPPRQE